MLRLNWCKRMIPFDTSAEAAAVQQEIFRRMTPEQRFKAAVEMSDSMRDLALTGIRSRRPELTEEEALQELMRKMYGSAAPL
jgi:hypothetical protein